MKYQQIVNDENDVDQNVVGISVQGSDIDHDRNDDSRELIHHHDDDDGSGRAKLNEERQHEDPDDTDEGCGWGWLVVFFAICTRGIFSGLLKSLGLMISTLDQQFDNGGISQIGLTCSLLATFSDFAGLFSSGLCQLCGDRCVAVFGGVLCSGALVLSSFSTSLVQLALCLSLAGTGFGLTFVPTLNTMHLYFDRRFALVNGLFYSGTGVGILLFAPLSQMLLEGYGWRGAMIVLGGLCGHVVVNGVALRRPPSIQPRDGHRRENRDTRMKKDKSITSSGSKDDDESRNQIHEDSSRRDSATSDSRSTHPFLSRFNKLFGFHLFKNSMFVLTLCMSTCKRCSSMAWMLYFVPHLQEKGLSPSAVVSIVSVAGICGTVTRAIHGLLIDVTRLTVEQLFLISTTAVAITLLLSPVLFAYSSCMAVGIIYGLASGVANPSSTVIFKQTLARDEFRHSISWSYGFGGAGRMLAGYILGLLYDSYGTYSYVFFLLGSMEAFTAVLVVALIVKRKGLSTEAA